MKKILVALVVLSLVSVASAELVLNSGMDSVGQTDMTYGASGVALDWNYANTWGGWFAGDGTLRMAGWGTGDTIPSWGSAALWQDTGATYAADTVYTMSVRWMDALNANYVSLQLSDATNGFAPITDVAFTTANEGGSGVWIVSTITLDTALNPGIVGNNIGVGFQDTSTIGGWVDVDYISVVPEPATMALLGLGGIALRRRKR